MLNSDMYTALREKRSARNLIKCAVGVLICIASAAAASDQHDPIMGTWIFRLSASAHSDPAQALDRATARYEPYADSGIRFTSEIYRKDGTVIRRSWTAAADGTDHAVVGDSAFDSVALRRVNRHAILFLYKKDGKIVSAQVRDVSPDLKSMTLTQLGITAAGAVMNNTVVFDRE